MWLNTYSTGAYALQDYGPTGGSGLLGGILSDAVGAAIALAAALLLVGGRKTQRDNGTMTLEGKWASMASRSFIHQGWMFCHPILTVSDRHGNDGGAHRD